MREDTHTGKEIRYNSGSFTEKKRTSQGHLVNQGLERNNKSKNRLKTSIHMGMGTGARHILEVYTFAGHMLHTSSVFELVFPHSSAGICIPEGEYKFSLTRIKSAKATSPVLWIWYSSAQVAASAFHFKKICLQFISALAFVASEYPFLCEEKET